MLTNAEIKRINSLAQKKYRQQFRQFIIEGARLISAAVEADVPFDALYLTKEFEQNREHQDLVDSLKKKKYIWEPVSEHQVQKLASTVSPSGILALCPLPSDSGEQITDVLLPGPWLYLDGISDPGNMGTLLRSAAWFGIIHIGLSADCVDAFNPKVVRSGMGAHFQLDIYPELSLNKLKDKQLTLIGADPTGDPVNQFQPDSLTNWALVMGNEAHGLSSESSVLLDYRVNIPRAGFGESLNVAVAGGILLDRLVNRP